MSTVLITGAASGIGRLSAVSLARAGHLVYASMREPEGRNSERAAALQAAGEQAGAQIRIVELDVQSQQSADTAARRIVEDCGQIDVVVNNAGHMSIGYMEAFTVEELAHQFDINAFGVHRVNRAVLPYMRTAGRGTLLYTGSTTSVCVPPFLGPYVAAKFAFDAIAQVTAYEVAPFGIETVIVMPGPFTHGTEHFPDASHASDQQIARQYAKLDPLVARYGEATESLFPEGADPDPQTVADEIVRLLTLPFGQKPERSVVDFTNSHVERINEMHRASAVDYLTRMGYPELLTVNG